MKPESPKILFLSFAAFLAGIQLLSNPPVWIETGVAAFAISAATSAALYELRWNL